MRKVELDEIGIDGTGRLHVRVSNATLTNIHRASASGVAWDEQMKAVCSPVPRDWSYADWFVQITKDARSEYAVDLVLADSTIWCGVSQESRAAITAARAQMPAHEPQPVDEREMARSVGDDRLRQEAREQFAGKQWDATVVTLERLQYPELMDTADRRRLEIACERADAARRRR